MSVKSKTRQQRRAKHPSAHHVEPSKKRAEEQENRAAGEIMSALLNAITFGALEPAPPSRA